jgi:hypothetical protein
MKHGLLMVSALALLAGCEKADKSKSTLADDLPVDTIKVVGAGVDPKVQLRYAVEKGTSSSVDMTLKMKMTTSAMAIPALPVVKMAMDMTCTDVEADGRMRFEMKVASIDVDASSAQAEPAR